MYSSWPRDTTSGVGYSALSDFTGNFSIFNVPAGTYSVEGYKSDLQLTPSEQTVASADVTGVTLSKADVALTTVSGSIQTVDAPNFVATSIVLALKSTFDTVTGRGDTPVGLRAPKSGPGDVTSAWTIEGVPDGDYVILAAFENDAEVRDPDTTIAGYSDTRDLGCGIRPRNDG